MIDANKKKTLAYFAEGRKRYKLMDFQNARKYFMAALKLDPADGPSEVYKKRCEEFIADPPPEDWDGVYVMKTK
ncbi:MAG: hypothetical protein HN368_23155 [Spirochaetales bacterium]|nr:hypothetical protein [Spirochaetales bacterium]